MNKNIRVILSRALLVGLPFVFTPLYAAKPINLRHQSLTTPQSFHFLSATTNTQLKEISRSMDFNKTLHIRMQQTYTGYPIFGADGIVHIAQGNHDQSLTDAIKNANRNTTMNGIVYEDIQADLGHPTQQILSTEQMAHATQLAIADYAKQSSAEKIETQNPITNIFIFVDQDNKAHWAYKISFETVSAKDKQLPAKPVYMMDATTFKIYKQWDEIKTDATENTAGGFGGNLKMGQLTYDGLDGDLSVLNISRNNLISVCSLKNADAVVKKCQLYLPIIGCLVSTQTTFNCSKKSTVHNNLYWDSDSDAVNGGYSPSNDALYNASVIKDMYSKWYSLPVLTTKTGEPMLLTMIVHLPIDNAFWNGKTMNFGDGVNMFYPLTSVGVAAHEISHGFTEQHANLVYEKQSGGMNEAFSDMAAQTAEFYAYQKNSWQIGPEIVKEKGKALRYMDQPSKDCEDKASSDVQCSIDTANEYTDSLNVHYSSGVYNRFFYLLSTSSNWNVKKAFAVMIQANSNYWTANTTFAEGACGVISATKDLGYGTQAVVRAFKKVAIDTSDC